MTTHTDRKETDPIPALIAGNPVASEIYWKVMNALQEAEEIGADMQTKDYMALMTCISVEVAARATACAGAQP